VTDDDMRNSHAEVVVGTAILRNGSVLAACRATPPELAGLWEFPGGKIEPGESEPDAVMRECREELGVSVRVDRALGRAMISETFELVLYSAFLDSAEPAAGHAHSRLAWLAARDIYSVVWLDVDRALIPAVLGRLASLSCGLRRCEAGGGC
jgi:8-oxo-dGTP diphosphatase